MNESEQQEIEKIKKECLTYFHQSPVWKKVLKGFRDKYSSYGRFGGKVVLKNLKVTGHRRTGGVLWQVFSWTEKCDSVCRKIPAGTESKLL